MTLLSRKLIIGIIAFTFCGSIAGADEIPHGWKQIDADGKFSFYLPSNMRDTGSSGMENYHKEYTNGKLNVSFDYDPYEVLAYPVRPGSLGKNFQEKTLEIDGRKAFMFVYETTDLRNRPYYFAQLSVGDLPNRDVKLRMWVSCWKASRLKIAETIFRSIHFNLKAENGPQNRKRLPAGVAGCDFQIRKLVSGRPENPTLMPWHRDRISAADVSREPFGHLR